jgi:hypothetical protein
MDTPVIPSGLLVAVLLSSLCGTALAQTGASGGTDTDRQEYDQEYLAEKRKEVDRLFEQGHVGKAYHLARDVRQTLDGTDLSSASADLYTKAMNRSRNAYKQLLKKVNRYQQDGLLTRSYRTVDRAIPRFEGDEDTPWSRKLRKRRQSLKNKVIQAHNDNRLEELPDFLRSDHQKASGPNGAGPGRTPETENKKRPAGGEDAAGQEGSGKQDEQTEADGDGSTRPPTDKTGTKAYPSPYRGMSAVQTKLLKRNAEHFRKAYTHIVRREWKPAFQVLVRLRKAFGKPRVPAIEAMMARVFLSNDRPRQAKKLVRPYAQLLAENDYNPRLSRVYCRAGKLRRMQGDLRGALRIQDQVAENGTGLVRALAGEEVGILLERMASDVSGYLKAKKSYRFALDVINRLQDKLTSESASDTLTNGHIREADLFRAINSKKRDVLYPVEIGYLGRYKRRVRSRLEEVKAKLEIIQHGLGFHLYRNARLHQKNGAWKKALADWKTLIEKANENEGTKLQEVLSGRDGEEVTIQDLKEQLPVAPVYRKAANYYKYVAKTELGNYREAYRGLQKFIKRGEEYQLYGGAARRFQADIALEYMYQLDRAIPLYTKALKWFNEVEKRDQAVETFTVPEKAMSVTKPPDTFRGRDRWGNVVWRLGGPSNLFNRNTADYYVEYQRMITKTHRSLCYFIKSLFEGNDKYREKALQDIKIINQVDAQSKRMTETGFPSNYTRLRDGYKIGKLFSTKAEQKHFHDDRNKFTALMVADFHYELERWGEAEQMYRRLVNRFAHGNRRNLPTNEEAYLTYVIGNCMNMQDRDEKAKHMLETFHRRYKDTPTWPRVMLTIDSYYTFSDRKYKVLKKVYRRMPNTEYGEEALMALGEWYYVNEEYKRAAKYFKKLKRETTYEIHKKAANSFLDRVEKRQSEEESNP